MDSQLIIQILIQYVGLVILLTFHEVGHAWMAWKCGDDTARRQGRVSLNPIVHMDFLGTVVLPLTMMFLSAQGSALAGFLIGWAKPVPVNPNNLRNPRLDDVLISLAGPWMNLLLAVALYGVAKGLLLMGIWDVVPILKTFAKISLILCFFNLIPIPPLDGSHVLRVLIGMSREAYARIVPYGFILVIVFLNLPGVRETLASVTRATARVMAGWFGMSA